MATRGSYALFTVTNNAFQLEKVCTKESAVDLLMQIKLPQEPKRHAMWTGDWTKKSTSDSDSWFYSQQLPKMLPFRVVWTLERNFHLEVEDRYESLSWVWGDQSGQVRIFVDDMPLEMTWSLFVALRKFRFEDDPRVLWIDTMCINQAHHQGETHQVLQKYHIYAQALMVLIWLGKGDQDMNQAMRYTQKSAEVRKARPKPNEKLEILLCLP